MGPIRHVLDFGISTERMGRRGMRAIPSQVIAGCFAMSAFAVAITAGLAAQNDAGPVLFRALAAMFIAYPVGLLGGYVCERAVQDHIRATFAGASEGGIEETVGGEDVDDPLECPTRSRSVTEPDSEQIVDNEEIIEV